MRKLTMFVLLATSAVPAMAAAQDDGGRQGRQDRQSERSDRPARAERAERPERAQRQEPRQQVQVERQMQARQVQQVQQQPVQIDRQVQVERRGRDVQVERQDSERGRVFGGRAGREQDGQASRDERMQQYREQMERRRAQDGGQQTQPQVQNGVVVDRSGRYRPGPDTSPALVGRPAPENRDARIAHRDRRDGVQWTSNWRNNHRYDWRSYRDRHRSTFRIGFYFDPFGYSYNRFGLGSYLYPSYYQSNYWISDTWRYRLPPAYGPYRWVRYHNDALMIDTWTGEVVDVIYGFFW